MSKSTVSHIQVWHSSREGNNYFKVHSNALGVMLTVSKQKQPKSYQRIKHNSIFVECLIKVLSP